MAIRKVARLGHPVLRRRADPIPSGRIAEEAVKRLVDDLRETMHEYEGVGLAAPQIFEPLRAFVMLEAADGDAPEEVRTRVWINPELKVVSDQVARTWEGCLSVPELRGLVTRPAAVEVTGYDEQGTRHRVRYEGFPAVVAQHEYDHLDGIVFLDRMTDMRSLAFLREFERYVAPADSEQA